MQERRLLIAICFMTTCAVAIGALPLMAIRRTGHPSTVTKLEASSKTTTQGEKLTLTAKVSPYDAVGTVTFYSGKEKIKEYAVAKGVAKLVDSTLPVGTDVLHAVFTGSKGYQSSTSGDVTVVVKKGSSCNCRAK